MTRGTVVGIFIAPEEGAPMMSLERVRAVAGRGLEGDRYFTASEGAEHGHPAKEVTLIASEGLEAARAEGLQLSPGEHRRNLVTRGVELDDLVGREFSIAGARLRGLEHNPPCRYLADLTGKRVVKPLARRGGIRAEILTDGEIAVGDRLSL